MTDTGNRAPETDCMVCLELADEALVTSCCTAIICYKCFQALQNKPCPKCRKNPFLTQVEQYVRKFLMEISPQIVFFVKPLTGGTFTLTMKELETTKMLFNRIHDRQGVPIDQMRLIFQTKQIVPSDKSLKSIGLQKHSNIHIIGRLNGGGKTL